MYRRNQNKLIVVYGETGTGKTYTCLKLARMIDPNFTLEQVVFDIDKFFALLNSGKLRPGSVVIFEELGVAANARRWFSDQNQWMSFVNQVFRTRNLIVFYTVPKLEMIDSQLAKLVHAHIEAVGIDYDKRRNMFKIYDPVQYDERTKSWYRHMVTYRRQGRTFKTRNWSVKKVNRKVAKEYEEMRAVYEAALTKKAEEALVEASQQSLKRRTLSREDLQEIAGKVITHKEDYMDERKFNLQKVMDEFEIGSPNARRIKELVKEKLSSIGFLITWR